jgi:hypothetical protein
MLLKRICWQFCLFVGHNLSEDHLSLILTLPSLLVTSIPGYLSGLYGKSSKDPLLTWLLIEEHILTRARVSTFTCINPTLENSHPFIFIHGPRYMLGNQMWFLFFSNVFWKIWVQWWHWLSLAVSPGSEDWHVLLAIASSCRCNPVHCGLNQDQGNCVHPQ